MVGQIPIRDADAGLLPITSARMKIDETVEHGCYFAAEELAKNSPHPCWAADVSLP